MAGWCNGSTSGSDPGAGGSNPSPATINLGRREETEQTTTAIDISALVTALSSAVTASDVVTLMATIITAGFGFVLVWFGARKLVRAFSAALKSGRLRI